MLTEQECDALPNEDVDGPNQDRGGSQVGWGGNGWPQTTHGRTANHGVEQLK